MSNEAAAAVKVGDVIRVRHLGRTRTVEVTEVWDDLDMIGYRLPYASTYVAGGQYEGSYRGTGSAWFSDVIA